MLAMAADTWTTIAAFTAAGLSVINVAATGVFNNRVQLSQWRRSKEIEIFADFTQAVNRYLDACAEIATAYDRISGADGGEPPSDDEKLDQIYGQQKYASAVTGGEFATVVQKLSELELIAGPAVVVAAQDVAVTLRSSIYPLRPGGPSHKMEQYRRISKEVGDGLGKLTRAIRLEIGTDSRVRFWRKKFRRSAERVYEV